jgi:hypothetical protein
LRNLEGVHLLGLLREKEKAYLGSFFLEPEDIKIKVWRPSTTLARNRAPLPSADIRLWGKKGPFIRPGCIGTVRNQTQMPINQSTPKAR